MFGSGEASPSKKSARAALRIHPHSSIFKTGEGRAKNESESLKWRERVVPSFNSLAIEASLPNLPGLEDVDTILSFNDDFFLLHVSISRCRGEEGTDDLTPEHLLV